MDENDSSKSKKDEKKKGEGTRHPGTDSPFFNSIRSPRKRFFTIHPEWVSENMQKLKTTDSTKPSSLRDESRFSSTRRSATVLGMGRGGQERRSSQRRCKSAPPPRTRNPITWERPDVSGRSNACKRETFTIHPEWASENPKHSKKQTPTSSQKPKITMENRYHTFPPRRCHSAPPIRTRNPITWENYNVSGR